MPRSQQHAARRAGRAGRPLRRPETAKPCWSRPRSAHGAGRRRAERRRWRADRGPPRPDGTKAACQCPGRNSALGLLHRLPCRHSIGIWRFEGNSAVRVDDDARWTSPRTRRTVSSGSSARTVPMPTTTASTRGAKTMKKIQCGRAIDIFRGARRRRNPAVQRLAELGDDIGPARIAGGYRGERRGWVIVHTGSVSVCKFVQLITPSL